MATHDAAHDHDLEYGPTPPDATREYTDIEPSIAWRFAIWLAVAMLISGAIVYGTFWFFEGQEVTANREAQVFPLAVGQVKEPPAPHLQTQPFKDIFTLRGSEQERLTGYGWVDKNTGAARIPVEEAMNLLLQRGEFRARPDHPQDMNQVVTDSSAGRVAVPR
jgi:hypothetical protein